MRRSVLALVGLTACSYQPGSFQHPGHSFPGMRETVGCLDLSIERRHDHDGAAIIGYEFGNRCDQPAIVDLAYARVTGRTITGNEVELVPYDPKGELRLLHLDGRSFGSEALAYNVPNSSDAIASICVDLGSIAHQDTKVVCLASDPPPEDKPKVEETTTPYDEPVPQAVDAEDPT